MNATVTLLVLAIAALIAPCEAASAPTLVAICPGGSVNGSRTQLKEQGQTVEEDRVTLSTFVYSFDVPEKGLASILYGKEETIGRVINEYPTYRTVVYRYGGVSYMDTVFQKANRVLCTEHKDSSGAPVATTWRLDCKIE